MRTGVIRGVAVRVAGLFMGQVVRGFRPAVNSAILHAAISDCDGFWSETQGHGSTEPLRTVREVKQTGRAMP